MLKRTQRDDAAVDRGSLIREALVSFILSLIVHLALRYRLGNPPFYDTQTGIQNSGGYGDFGAQYLPFHARFRDQLHGGDLSGWFFSWDASVGVPTYADYTTYLGGPFPFLVALVPQDKVYVAIVIGVLLKLALASALMHVLVRTVNPGIPTFVAHILAVSYSANAWVTDLAIFTPQWLDALYGVPLLCLAALRLRRENCKPWVLVVLSVALIWWANFYSAYMASLYAGFFFVVFQVANGDRAKSIIRNTIVFASCGVAGVLLTAVLLLPTLWSILNGVGLESARFYVAPWEDIVIRFLPYTQGDIDSPNLYVGVFALLVSVTVFVARHQTTRFKVSWAVGTLFLVASLRAGPLIMLWNALQKPHGSVHRWVFVFAAWIIVSAAFAWPPARSESKGSFKYRLSWLSTPQMLVAFMVGSFLVWVTRSKDPISPRIYWAPDLAAIVVVGVLGLLFVGWILSNVLHSRRARENKSKASTALVFSFLTLIVSVSLVELVYSSTFTRLQAKRSYAEIPIDYEVERARLDKKLEDTTATWPLYRQSEKPIPEWAASYAKFNASSRYLYPGTDYYSTTMQAKTTNALIDLGYKPISRGRHSMAPNDDILYAILSAGSLDSTVKPLPMVREVARSTPAERAPKTYVLRELLAGTTGLYHFPEQIIRDLRGGAVVPGEHLYPGETYAVEFSCPVGRDAFIVDHGHRFTASAFNGLEASSLTLENGLGRVVADTSTALYLLESDSTILAPEFIVGCADYTALLTPNQSQAPSKLEIIRNDVRGEFSEPVERIVISTPAVDGWQCQTGGIESKIEPLAGFLSFEMNGGTEFGCEYRPPLFLQGTILSLLTASGVLFLGIFLRWRSLSSVEYERGDGEGEGYGQDSHE